MPIYEFYCPDCHRILSFFSRRINTSAAPACPRCGKGNLSREVSVFASPRSSGDAAHDAENDLPVNDRQMETALETLAGEAEQMNADDPRQAAGLMRKFSSMTGMRFGEGMREAIERMEAGEDPERIESELGDALEEEEPFEMDGGKALPGAPGRRGGGRPPQRDETLYEM